ncbi:hypothetical protein Patl1_33572 [Pistacia atlantica]|uniref:Uncharacterized protein n=1 Tax=Pistacia atlantica TaxID=434234 RepID=A0ACC0ZQU7_9ROSI|nr:hypothetical protein Patl1_33572 [Pistacia atlantica]
MLRIALSGIYYQLKVFEHERILFLVSSTEKCPGYQSCVQVIKQGAPCFLGFQLGSDEVEEFWLFWYLYRIPLFWSWISAVSIPFAY